MSAAEMTERIAKRSPRFNARLAGVFYSLMFPMGGLVKVHAVSVNAAGVEEN
jgi:hypothetical protein